MDYNYDQYYFSLIVATKMNAIVAGQVKIISKLIN